MHTPKYDPHGGSRRGSEVSCKDMVTVENTVTMHEVEGEDDHDQNGYKEYDLDGMKVEECKIRGYESS